MKRREALSMMAVMFGGSMVGGKAFLSGCSRPRQEVLLDEEDVAFLNEVGETILPATPDTPGAKDADVGAFMKTIVTDFYSDGEAKIFRDGIVRVNEMSDDRFGLSFVRLLPEQKSDILLSLEEEAAASLQQTESGTGSSEEVHYYIMMKQLAIWGYLSSEIVAMEAFDYNPNPGRFEPCLTWEEGDRIMFPRVGRFQAMGYAVHHMNR